MKMSIRYIILACLLTNSLFAQVIDQDTLNVDQVEVVKSFDAKLKDAEMIKIKPKLVIGQKQSYEYDYNITVAPLDIDYPLPTLKPLAMEKETAEDINHLYAKLGYGTMEAAYAYVSYQMISDDQFDINVYGQYDRNRGINNSIDYAKGGLIGSYRLFDNSKLSFDLNGGYEQTLPELYANSSNHEYFKNVPISGKIGLSNLELSSSGFDYEVEIGTDYINHLNDNEDNASDYNEITHFTAINLAKHFDQFSLMLASDAFAITKDGSFEDKVNYGISISPGTRYKTDNFTIKAAANLFWDKGDLYAYPDVLAEVSLMEHSLMVYAGVNQERSSNSRYSHNTINPLIKSDIENINSTITKKHFIGAKGKLFNLLTYHINGGYKDIDNLALYNLKKLTYDYQYAQATSVYLDADVSFKLSDDINLGCNIVKDFYDIDLSSTINNLPSFRLATYANIKLLDDQLHILPRLIVGDNIEELILDEAGNEISYVNGNGLFDLNIEVSYYPLKHIGLWVRGNDIFDNQYQRLGIIKSVGRYIQGGVSIKF